MKIIYILLSISILLIAPILLSAEQKQDLGVGIIVGEPTGISIKYANFPVAGIAWSLENHLHLHCDYWFYEASLVKNLKWYIGGGAKLTLFSGNNENKNEDTDSSFGLGIRIPFGLQYYIIPKLELFGETVPGLGFIPSTEFDFDIGIGLRYHF